MSEPNKKAVKKIESYSPKKPDIAIMMDELYNEKVIDTVVIEGVAFQIVEKGKTLFAGAYGIEPDIAELIASNDPVVYENDGDILNKGQDVEAILSSIQNVITPDYNICLNIDYTTDRKPCARLVGKETTSCKQPDGVHVIEAEPTLLIKVKYTHAAWLLTKKIIGSANQYRVTELFNIIKHYFCEGEQAEYEYNGDNGTGNADAEIFYNAMGRGAAVPVKKRIGGISTKAKYSTDNIVIADDFKCPATLTNKEIKDKQEPIKEFEKITFAGYDWLVLEKQSGKSLLLSEILIENRQFHHSFIETTWAACDLRNYLNHDFYLNAFSDEQRSRIIKTTLPPYINPWYGLNNNKARIVQLKEGINYNADAAISTDDFIFILSIEEIMKYFGDNGDLDKRVGYTWQGENAEVDFALGDGFGQFIFDQYSNSRIAKDAHGRAQAYWARTPGYQYHYNFGIYDNGNFWPATGGGVHQTLGVRPAMWVKL